VAPSATDANITTAKRSKLCCANGTTNAVVTAIIALARSLGLRVVGEGVETLRQMDVLHRLGCTVMQGFLFARPMLPDDLERWLENTVLPREAPWIIRADSVADDDSVDVQAALLPR